MTRGTTYRQSALVRRAAEEASQFENKLFGAMYAEAVRRKVEEGDESLFKFMEQLERPPVSIEEFIDSPEFLGSTDLLLWPEVRRTIIEINCNWWRGLTGAADTAYTEAVLKGATSTGKSSIAQVTTLYHLYLLSCLKNPQALYGLPKTTSIVFAIMAAKPHVTKKVVYMPMRKMIGEMPYFQKHMRYEYLIESEMYFSEKNIRVVPGGADADSILGEAVIGGVIDEINFMHMVLKSKKAEVSTGRAGLYDQATTIHEAMVRRKKGRFITKGPQIGLVIPSSSTRYKGDFTDKREEQVQRLGEKDVYIFNKKQYEVWPQDRYCGEVFRLLVGNDTITDTRVLGDSEQVPDGSLVLDVPIEYKVDFQRNPHDALRDIVGMSTSSISPFIRRRFKIYDCISAGAEDGLESFLMKDNVILGVDGMPQVKRHHYCQNPSRPRYVHIDLAITGDRVGIAMLRFDGLQEVERSSGGSEMLPVCSVEMACSIEPDGNNEIELAEVRMWVKQLRDVFGYPIKAVTYDGFQCISGDTRIWSGRGLVEAKGIEVGDVVQSRIGPRPVTKVFSYGSQPTLKVTTTHGHSIEITAGHKVEARTGWSWAGAGNRRKPVWEWVRADALVVGQHVRVWGEGDVTEVDAEYVKLLHMHPPANARTRVYPPEFLTESVAKALGVIWGDGSIGGYADGKGFVSVTGTPDEVEDAQRILAEAFRFDGKYTVIKKEGEVAVSLRVSCQHLVDWLRLNGFGKPHVPEHIMRSPKSVQAAFLSGLFATDGSVKSRDGQPSFSTMHLRTARYAQDALSMLFGIETCITTTNPSKYGGSFGTERTEHYIVSVRGSREVFMERVGFAYADKQAHLSRRRAVRGRTILTKIASIAAGSAEVYDFEVEEDHSYLANGFVSHNSIESRQQWKKQGMKTGAVSVDRTSTPYKQLRDAINDTRIKLYDQPILVNELFELEYDAAKDKVDHPVHGGKDVADAVCGAYTTMLERRASWMAAAGDDEAHRAGARADYASRYDGDRPV